MPADEVFAALGLVGALLPDPLQQRVAASFPTVPLVRQVALWESQNARAPALWSFSDGTPLGLVYQRELGCGSRYNSENCILGDAMTL